MVINRPSVTPLISAFTALHASENAERMGKLEDAAKHATEAIERVQEWREGIWSCLPDSCAHDVAQQMEADKWNGYIAVHKE